MKIYTKTGDDGTTGLVGGSRVAKDDLRMVAIGEVDELNASIGWVRAASLPADIDQMLEAVQSRLFDLGAELATPAESKFDNAKLNATDVVSLESRIDQWQSELPPLANFILPGGSEAAARLHVARSVCRRAERALLTFHRHVPQRDVALAFLNRLSDTLFVAARTVNDRSGVEDVKWRG